MIRKYSWLFLNFTPSSLPVTNMFSSFFACSQKRPRYELTSRILFKSSLQITLSLEINFLTSISYEQGVKIESDESFIIALRFILP